MLYSVLYFHFQKVFFQFCVVIFMSCYFSVLKSTCNYFQLHWWMFKLASLQLHPVGPNWHVRLLQSSFCNYTTTLLDPCRPPPRRSRARHFHHRMGGWLQDLSDALRIARFGGQTGGEACLHYPSLQFRWLAHQHRESCFEPASR